MFKLMGCVKGSESGDVGELSSSSEEDLLIWLMDFLFFESMIWGVRRPRKPCARADVIVILVLRTLLMLKERNSCMKNVNSIRAKRYEEK